MTTTEQLQADTDDMVLDHWIVAASTFYARKSGREVGMEAFLKPDVIYTVSIIADMMARLAADRLFWKGTMICLLKCGRLGLVKLGQNPIGPMDFGILRLT